MMKKILASQGFCLEHAVLENEGTLCVNVQLLRNSRNERLVSLQQSLELCEDALHVDRVSRKDVGFTVFHIVWNVS